ncbi:MAG: hypothetical protein UW24_C0015G0019 [Parcubacteria group bacterium GW2011_GWA2_44_12]|nr:MAG: hypothetical protein UW24_C0015G0019 [Parcubacteria group bacterium GW2011_GWA2_44_12]
MKKEILSYIIKAYDTSYQQVQFTEAKIASQNRARRKPKLFFFAVRIFFYRMRQNFFEFLIILLADPAQSFTALKKREEKAVSTVSYVEYRIYSKKLKLLSFGGISSVLMATLVVSFLVSFLQNDYKGYAATYTFTQDDFGGSANADLYPIEPTNRTGWTNYSQKDATVSITNVGGKNVLTVTDTVNHFDTSDTDFDATGKTYSYTALNGVSGSGASVILSIPE